VIANQKVDEVSLSAVVIRADGSREQLGVVSYWNRRWWKRLAWKLRQGGVSP
jgi:hypothetical protein